ncbi:MAG: DNA-3-methyladenine glycosylase 2 family protein [Calditrichales bacterium]|nr:MAG: DNA-3-methyladenine glycosylase 2 family protein [Calditrichales bacterium]
MIANIDPILDQDRFQEAIDFLVAKDPDLETIVANYGPPPMWEREPGFPTLVHIILEQQVSLASAKAAFSKLLNLAPELTPAQFLTYDDVILKKVGFSRQKTRYCRNLALAIMDGSLPLDQLPKMNNQSVLEVLTRITGIGRWTADIYLLMALKRTDAWPGGDLALAIAIHEIKNLPARPSLADLDEMGKQWQPYRSVAARILWHHYLSK